MVYGAYPIGNRWRCSCRAWVPDHIFCLPRKHLCLGNDRSLSRAEGDIDWTVRPCSPPDVSRRSYPISRHTFLARFVVGIVWGPHFSARRNMEIVRRGKILDRESAWLFRVTKQGKASLVAVRLVANPNKS